MLSKKIVLAVVSHRQEDLVSALLTSLDNISDDSELEIVMIDNLPPGIQISLEPFSFPISYHKNQSPLGFAENVNRAFQLRGKDADYFCIINPDVQIQRSIFPTLIQRMEEFSIDVGSPVVLDQEGQIQDSFRPFPTPWIIIKRRLFPRRTTIDPDDLPDIIYPDWIAGLFMLMKASVFHNTGGFNEKYKLYFEDVDFCLRAQLLGYKIAVFKEITILHDAQRKSRKNIHYLLYHVASAIRYFSSKAFRAYKSSPR